MNVLIIDNYDSYTFNLYQAVGEVLEQDAEGGTVIVKRNDEVTCEDIRRQRVDRLIISPGPGEPSDPAYFGVSAKVLTELGQRIPVFAVCLGMQGMAHCFGGKVVRAKVPMHGKTSLINHDGRGVFTNLPQNISVMRYHSLVADPDTLPDVLEVTAVTNPASPMGKSGWSSELTQDQEIMGLRHKRFPIEGVQFHPESFATEGGMAMIGNFLYGRGAN